MSNRGQLVTDPCHCSHPLRGRYTPTAAPKSAKSLTRPRVARKLLKINAEDRFVAANLSGKIANSLKVWIEELLPEHHDADGGAQPLNLEELQKSLRDSHYRDAMKQRPCGMLAQAEENSSQQW